MGVPAFFRWLTRKYSSVVVECVEEVPTLDKDGQPISIDASQKNPNGVEFDNFYLDMNGIIHPCTHPENKPAPKNEDEMMVAIFECIDRLFKIVRPRKLIYMAIDGVAPRAKMNQQRSRRFRAAKETKEKVEQIQMIRSQLEAKGIILPPEKEKSSSFDSNCITPGTEFMSRLTDCLNYFIHDKLNNDPGWKGLKVILSDASVPGEGEHKIMDFIRRQRGAADYDPNTHHCLCGADADLIMLGLATHEPYFTIIREEFIMNQPHRCEICSQTGHEMKECQGLPNPHEDMDTLALPPSVTRYIFVRLNVLREYLEEELQMNGLPFKYDFERVIDDWVFMCFFVGNDFLPHLPSLEIREGAIDRLITLYKRAVFNTGGFLTDSGDVNLKRVEVILKDLGTAEDEIFRKRHRNDVMYRSRNRQRLFQEKVQKPQFQNLSEEEIMKQIENDDPEPNDDVRLWDDGYKDRYYQLKFNLPPNDVNTRHHIGMEYARGLCWVLKYYYQGCASWDWFFPFHYAPFASDIVNLDDNLSEFAKGTQPFSPLEQLMGVFPAASRTLVPTAWADLMINPESNILDFYPIDFMIDLNGKKFAWQGVALLPFVDEARLRKSLKPYYHLLTKDEQRRNTRGNDRLYVSRGADCFEFISFLGKDKSKDITELKSSDIFGTVFIEKLDYFQGKDVLSPIPGLGVLHNNEVFCVRFEDPKYTIDHKFFANRLEGTREPPRIIMSKDRGGGNSGNRGGRGRRPIIGMVQRNDQASLDESAHRALRHYIPTDHAAPLGRQGLSSNNFRPYNRPRGQDFNFRRDLTGTVDLTQDDGPASDQNRGYGGLHSLKENLQIGPPFNRGSGGSQMNRGPTTLERYNRPRNFGSQEGFSTSSQFSEGPNSRNVFGNDRGLPFRRGFDRMPKFDQSESGSSFNTGRSHQRGGYGGSDDSGGSRGGFVRNPKFDHSKTGVKPYHRGFNRNSPYDHSDATNSDRDRGFRRTNQPGFSRGHSSNRGGGNDFPIAGGTITKDDSK